MNPQHSKLWHLERINLLKNLTEEELQKLEERTHFKTADKNQYVYFPEEPSKILFFSKEG